MIEIPQEIKEDFKLKDINIVVPKFEQYMLQDIYMNDEESKLKLNRDVTSDFIDEIEMYKNQKRNIRIVLKGATRSGKSLIGLKIGDLIIGDSQTQKFDKDINSIVCGNQNEYRRRLQKAEFGDFYLVDENFFGNAGLGTNIDKAQLQDYNNIIAKKNISVLFITPEKFLNVGATMGLSSYGRDSQNWLSRFLVYNFKDGFPYLIGYIIIDIGALFRKYGCFVYKQIGGCNNTNKFKLKDIDKKFIKHSSCIGGENFDSSKVDENLKTCPFFNLCKHPLCKYEHKKDSWIEKEMKGGLDQRTEERYTLALKLILMFNPKIDLDNNQIKFDMVKNAKDLKSQVDPILPTLTNTKFGVAENELIIQTILSNTKLPVLANTLVLLENEKLLEKYFEFEKTGILKELYEKAKILIQENREI